MPLYDVTYGERIVDPKNIEKIEVLQALKRKMHPTSFDRVVKTVDEGIESTAQNLGSKLVWTKTGALFGHYSNRPKKDVDHLWDKIIGTVGDGKECLLAVGALLLWRISLRPENYWLVYRQESDNIDPDTGKKITISEYWINENFTPKDGPKKKHTIIDLLGKFKKGV